MSNFNDKNLYIATIQTNLIKTLFESLSLIVTDVNWIFSENGMKAIAINPTKSIGIQVSLTSKGFVNGGIYYCSPGKVHNVGINILMVSSLLKIMKDKNHVFKLYSNKGSETINIGIDDANINSKRNWETSLIECDLNPETSLYEKRFNDKYDVVMGIPAGYFQKEIKYLEKLGKKINITVQPGKSLILNVESDKMVNTVGKNTLVPGSENGIKFYSFNPEKNIISGTFTLLDLSTVVKCTGLSSTSHIKMHMSMDQPLMIEYPIGDLGEIKFCIANLNEKL